MSRKPVRSTDETAAPTCIRCDAPMLDGGDRWWCRGGSLRHELEIVWPEDAPRARSAVDSCSSCGHPLSDHLSSGCWHVVSGELCKCEKGGAS